MNLNTTLQIRTAKKKEKLMIVLRENGLLNKTKRKLNKSRTQKVIENKPDRFEKKLTNRKYSYLRKSSVKYFNSANRFKRK